MTAEDAFPLIGPDAPSSGYRGAVVLPVDRHGRMLLQLRDRVPGIVWPGAWSLFGGGVEPGEALHAAAAREFAEETGIERPEADFTPFARIVSPVSGSLLFAFELRLDGGPAQVTLGEGAGFGFFEPGDFARLDLVPAARILLEAWRRR